MSNDPDQIRRDIERTRSELSSNVEALTDKVTPSHIVARRVDSATGAVTGVKERVMGTTSAITSSTSSSASSLGDHASSVASGQRSSPAGSDDCQGAHRG